MVGYQFGMPDALLSALTSGQQAHRFTGEQTMMKLGNNLGLSVFLLGSALGVSAFAQSGTAATQPAQATDPAATSSSPSSMNPNDKSTYATGKPLEQQSK
jgi:hypothetical protein